MRPSVLGVLVAVALLSSGCSHVAGDRGDGWSASMHSAKDAGAGSTNERDIASRRASGWIARAPSEAPSGGHSRGDRGWAPIEPVRGGPWQDMVVRPVSAKGPHAVAHADGPYLLDSGDQLRIFVYGQPNLSRVYKVDHNGNVMIPLIGVLRAQRKTTYQVAASVRARLGAKYVRDPQVTVDIHENRPFFILGEVRTPGQYPYVNGMTVETAVAIAGGYTPRASNRNFRISRRVDGAVEVDKGSIDYVVQPGDTIKVPERFF